MNNLLEKLLAQHVVVGLVKKMQPVEVALIVHRQLGLSPVDSAKVVHDLFSKIQNDKSYGQDIKQEDYINMFPDFQIQAKDFPPPNRQKSDDWPYDPMSIATMDLKNRTRNRPLTNEHPFKSYSDLNKVGGDATGIYGIDNPTSQFNNISTSSNSWSKEGVPGWSKSPSNKEFDLPEFNLKLKLRKKGK